MTHFKIIEILSFPSTMKSPFSLSFDLPSINTFNIQFTVNCVCVYLPLYYSIWPLLLSRHDFFGLISKHHFSQGVCLMSVCFCVCPHTVGLIWIALMVTGRRKNFQGEKKKERRLKRRKIKMNVNRGTLKGYTDTNTLRGVYVCRSVCVCRHMQIHTCKKCQITAFRNVKCQIQFSERYCMWLT